MTKEATTRNRFDSGIRTGTIESGVNANTDLAGPCVVDLVPGCTGIAFAQTYRNPPNLHLHERERSGSLQPDCKQDIPHH
jgi:hypothetical protein